jgi:hypothetical protein
MTMTERVRSEFPECSDEFCSLHGRAVRDKMLAETDWRVAVDAPGDRDAWIDYRQQLRDLPADPNWPDVALPDPPEVN